MEDEFRREIDELKRRIQDLTANEEARTALDGGAKLTYPLDDATQKVLKDNMQDNIMDIVWDGYFSYFTGFTSSEEFTSAGTTVTFDGGGLLLGTSTTTNTSASVFRDQALLEPIDFSKQSRFRITVNLGAVSNRRIEFGIGGLNLPNIDGDGYGFFIEDNEIHGFAQRDFSDRTSVRLGTVTGTATYRFDARFFPNGRVDFYIDNELRGSVANDLPINTPDQFFGVAITTQTTATRSIFIHAFEFMQRRF